MSGLRSRRKGVRVELAIAKALQANGLAAVKVSRAYTPGHDIALPIAGRDLRLEVKARADGFRELYGWLDERDVLIVIADRREPLVVSRLSLAPQIAKPSRLNRAKLLT
jgi:hypothetical protein